MSDFDLELQAAQEDVARSRRTAKWTMLGLALLSIFLVGAVAMAVWLAQSNGDLAAENAAFGEQQQGEKKEIAKEAQQALCGTRDTEIFDKDLCEKLADAAQEPTVTPEVDPLDTGPSQAELVNAFRAYCAEGANCKGRDGAEPTADDIAAAFGRFCSDGRCNGPAGKDGADGAPAKPLAPEYEMVLAAVTDVCTTGICTGPAGKDGINGTNGVDGQNATQEMMFAAVQQFCADGACQGAKGADGKDGASGADGAQGVSITDVQCVGEGADSMWQITLSDGQVLNGGGPCKAMTIGPPDGKVLP